MLCELHFLVKLPALNSTNHTHTNNLTALHNSLSGKALYNSTFLTYPEWKSTHMPVSVQFSDFIKRYMLQLLSGKQSAEQLVYLVQDKNHLCFSPAFETVTSPLCTCVPSKSILFLLVNHTQLAQLQTLQNAFVPGHMYVLLLMISLRSLLSHVLMKKTQTCLPHQDGIYITLVFKLFFLNIVRVKAATDIMKPWNISPFLKSRWEVKTIPSSCMCKRILEIYFDFFSLELSA